MPRNYHETRQLIDALAAQYMLGGPQVGPYMTHHWDSIDAHGYLIAALDYEQSDDEGALHRLLRDCQVTNVAALRAMLRLVGSHAALTALNWVLDEQLPDGFGTRTPDAEEVLCEARAVLSSHWTQ